MRQTFEIKQDGGPAFPSTAPTQNTGMSLRDWFAGQWLAGYIANPHGYFETAEAAAQCAYTVADAMLEARK